MPNSKSNLAVFVVLLVALGALVWKLFSPTPPSAIPAPVQASLSPKINIDIYVDGSGSIKNFLKAGKSGSQGENSLLAFLAACENELSNPPATGGWSHENNPVGFWRFGADAPARLASGELRILANNPDGYMQVRGFGARRTSIEIPVKHDPQEKASARVPELKIIVTDLYQTDGTNSKPAEALADKYLTDAGAVAVYGIRNPYWGPVEDLPALKGASLPPGAADTMPFYIIIAGDNAADVYHMQEVLLNASTIGPVLRNAFKQGRAFSMYFSKDPGWRALSAGAVRTASVTVDWRDPNDKKKRLGIGPPLKENFNGSSLDLLTIRKGKAMVRFSSAKQVNGKTQNETPIGDDPQIHTLAYVRRSAGRGQPERERYMKAEDAVSAGPCPNLQYPNINDVCATFDYDRLHSYKGAYLFEFDAVANEKADVAGVTSSQMKRWNIEDSEESRISAFPSIPGVDGLHPGRTPNLSGILTALQNRVFTVTDPAEHPVVLTRYELYVEAR